MEKSVSSFQNQPWILRVCRIGLLKTLWEKEKLLVTSNFSFSHSVFSPFGELSVIFIVFEIVSCKLFEFGKSLIFVIWERVNPFPNKPWFLRVCNTSLLKTQWEKEKLLVTSNFSFSHSVFYLSKDLPVISIKFQIVVCNLY